MELYDAIAPSAENRAPQTNWILVSKKTASDYSDAVFSSLSGASLYARCPGERPRNGEGSLWERPSRQAFFSQSLPVSLKSRGYTPMTAKITTA